MFLNDIFNTARHALFELDLITFSVTTLATGFVNQVLSQFQTIRPFYPQDATLWVCHIPLLLSFWVPHSSV